MSGDYQLVQLANGEQTLFSTSYGEKMHPGLGPSAEAEILYVRQLKIRERLAELQASGDEFVIWDIGLGAAANAIAALRATREISGRLHVVSFDNTIEPLAFALENAAGLGYLAGYEEQIRALIRDREVTFDNGKLKVHWAFYVGDYPELLSASLPDASFGAPRAIFYDAFSPAKNPAMWTLRVFENLFDALDPSCPCALTTYSRSTFIRATLLLAGFFVGVGHATGTKEETTIAANTPVLITEPLDARWLARASRSDSAEPLRERRYTRSPLAAATLDKLRRHPQFGNCSADGSIKG